jgi:hypothetical protein
MAEYAKPGEPTCEEVSDFERRNLRCQFTLVHEGGTHNAKYHDERGVAYELSWRTDLEPSKRKKKQAGILGGVA